MAASTKINISTGAGPTNADAEATGIKFNREDTATGTTAVPKPTAAGTNYSFYKTLYLNVESGGGSTSISNRAIRYASSPSAGLTVFFKDGGDTYTQATSGNRPADNGTTNDATPATYTAMTTSFQNYDTASEAATNSTRNGNYVIVAAGVSNNYVGGAGSAIALPNIELRYDEA